MKTPEWIAELSRDERNRIDNGISIQLDSYALGRAAQAYEAVIDHLRKEQGEQPSSSTSDLIDQLVARVELLDDRIDMINGRLAEWRTWRQHARHCIHGILAQSEPCPCPSRNAPLSWTCRVCGDIHPADHEGMFCGVCMDMVACVSCERAFNQQCHERGSK